MTPLEQRYRKVLRLLPAYYRNTWEEDMVATFMARAPPTDTHTDTHTADADDAEDAVFAAEHGSPSGSDVAAVAMLAVRLRLGCAGASPRHRAWGAAVRRAALVGFLAQAVLALAAFHSQSPPIRRRPWFVALSAGIVLVAMLLILPWSLRNTPLALLFDLPGIACVLVSGAGIGLLVAAGAGCGGPGAEWSAALVLLGVGVFAVRVVTLLPYYPWSSAGNDQLHVLITAGAVEAGMTSVVTVALAVVARQALRALPDPAGAAVPSR